MLQRNAGPLHRPGSRSSVDIRAGMTNEPYSMRSADAMANATAHHQSTSGPLGPDGHPRYAFADGMSNLELSYSPLGAFSIPTSAAATPTMNFIDLPGDPHQQSHDETCLDHCMAIAMFNGSRGYHRGGPAPLMARGRQTFPHFLYPSHPANPFDGSSDLHPAFLQHKPASQSVGPQQPRGRALAAHGMEHRNFHGGESPAFLGLAPGAGDHENQSVKSCCNSDCEMPDKCSDAACEDTTSACNDQNCPERPAPRRADADVADGAAALISINHAEASPYGLEPSEDPRSYMSTNFDPSRRHTLAGLGMNEELVMHDSHHQSHYQGLQSFGQQPWNMQDITAHVLRDHTDDTTSGCTGPCLVESLPMFSTCHLPSLEDYPIFDPFSVGSYMAAPETFTECGTSIATAEAFVHHFNEHHRQQLIADHTLFSPSLPPPSSSKLMTGTGLMMSPLSGDQHLSHSPPPLEHSSPVPGASNDFGKMDFHVSQHAVRSRQKSSSLASSQTPATLSKSPPSETPGTPGTEVTMGPDWEHKCLWHHPSTGAICGATFNSPEDLFEHVNTNHVKTMARDSSGRYICQWDGCSRASDGKGGFPQRSKMERHMQTHVGCKYPSPNRRSRRLFPGSSAYRLVSPDKPHVCAQCGAGFSAKQALDQHLLIHNDAKPLECPTCGKKIRHQSALS